MRNHFVSTLLAAPALTASAQTYTITTVAGGGLPPTPTAATSAAVWPTAVTTDSAGNIYFVSTQAGFKVDSTGTLTHVAGAPSGTGTLADGGPATSLPRRRPER